MVRRVVVSLPMPEYRQLSALAKQEERSVDRQASYELRRMLASRPREGEARDDASDGAR